MLCTYIRDQYKENEAEEIFKALNDIASPTDSYGWASAGIYCFWDPLTNEVLYIGLAAELGQRFQQHNGLVSCNPKGCKVEQVRRWFSNNESLGYSVLVQSIISQPICNGLKKKYPSLDLEKNYDKLLGYGQYSIERSEGLLIAAHQKQFGKTPSWNKMGGAIAGQELATQEHIHMVKLFTNSTTDESVARVSIREISKKPSFEVFEQFLHGIRLKMILTGSSFYDVWNNASDDLELKERMLSLGYIRFNEEDRMC